MSAPFIIPFNNQPISVNVRTTSYTIPAGRYAKVQGYFTASGQASSATYTQQSMTINGSSVLWESFKVGRGTTGTSVTFTFPSTCLGNALIFINTGANSFTTTVGFNGYVLYTGTALYSTTLNTPIAGGEQVTISEFQLSSAVRSIYASFVPLREKFETWVPTGTILAGTGAYVWYVEEFNMIS